MGHANDGGGSIRVPAAWCGLVGLKPSRGRVPLGPAVAEAVGGFAHEFAVTRTVRDAAALLDTVNGPAPGDRYYVARPEISYTDALGAQLRPLRVAVHTTSFFGLETVREARVAVEAAAATLQGLGHHVEEACPEVSEDALRSCVDVVWCVDLAGLAGTFSRIMARAEDPQLVEAASSACIRRGRELTALDLEAAMAVMNSTSRRWGRFLEEYDVFVCPTTPAPAPATGIPDQNDERFDAADAWMHELFGRIPFTPIANLTGQPSISLPLGQADDGMPLGVMLTAQTLREDLLLRVAAALEEATPWAHRRPGIHAS
jgi:amidase